MKIVITFTLLVLLSIFPVLSFGHDDDGSDPVPAKVTHPTDGYGDDFRLIDHNDVSQAMSYYSDYKTIMLIGFNGQCLGNLEQMEIMKDVQALSEKYKAKVFFIDPDLSNDRKEIKKLMMKSKMPYPVLMDEIQMISNSYSIKNAGDFALLDGETLNTFMKGTLFKKQCTEILKDELKKGYSQGKNIDCYDKSNWEKIQSYLKLSYVPGKCHLGFKPTPNINYVQHVAPVILNNCIKCHRNEDFGSFKGYQKVLGWSAMIKQVVRDQRMPPEGIDQYYHGFHNDYNLRDLRYLVEWSESKKIRGLGTDPLENLPPPRPSYAEYFEKNKANLVFKQKKPHIVPAEGVFEYQEVELAGPFKEDLWIKAINLKINSRVVHHANLLLLDKPLTDVRRKTTYDGMRKIAKSEELISKVEDNRGIAMLFRENLVLTSKKVDNSPIIMKPGLAMHIPKGKYLAVELHYNSIGKVEENSAEVELYLYKKTKRLKNQKVLSVHRNKFVIPPGAKNYLISSRVKLPGTITITAFKPHFHYRGKSIKYVIERPNGERETLLSVPFYQFKSQSLYILQNPKVVPDGSYLITESVYDNSKEFFQNPDETINVPQGSQTYTDEMHLPRLFYVDGVWKKRGPLNNSL